MKSRFLNSMISGVIFWRNYKSIYFKIQIAVLPQSVYEKIALEIIVDDVNDNAPRFSKKSVSVEISESVLPKDRIEAKGENIS